MTVQRMFEEEVRLTRNTAVLPDMLISVFAWRNVRA
jgi:hypothetical protein